ncbi:ubiquitin-conjugating enzyme E2 6 [Dissoconium aciculare CBS 342.82]|uniref:Ubiquitin-conjugating enzyme E2 6 n=1 Tax=Dissoconium aciculare CBS 342.82 TaxID=1314786 RepID=A0A6J3MFJ8_9PEZI|nr:ubiquitin-conjugating enzyme E2 6 [Dissoconium aciculare CBS 342.82]KAF1826750.1 ubiquitin-conjugating enzyme E2 6 [Dissoconium aciculare CBS 342.82]
MATRAAHKRLTREYASISQNPPDYILAHPSESNILEWHYVLTGPPQTPYEGGQYWGTLVFPPDYPFAPPAIRMHTPSGRFRCSERLCLSISDFHPKSFNPAWEVSTILLGVLSFMTSEEMTTGSISATPAERRAHAARTRWWNSTGGGSTHRLLPGQQSSDGSATSTSSTGMKGFGAIKAGDGGRKFREQWPELDEANWKWMETEHVNPQTGKLMLNQHLTAAAAAAGVASSSSRSCTPDTSALRRSARGSNAGLGAVVVETGHAAKQAGQSWLTRNKYYLVAGVLFGYVALARLLQDQEGGGS